MVQSSSSSVGSHALELPKQKRQMRRRANRLRKRHALRIERLEDRRLLTANWRNPVDALDVDASSFIVPLDALLVINDINSRGSRALPAKRDPSLPFVDVSGDQFVTPLDALILINYLNFGAGSPRVLVEGKGLASQVDIPITLGQNSGARSYRVQLDAAFDTSSKSAAVEDVLSVYLIDPKNPSQTLLDRGRSGTSLFSLVGTQAEYTPGRVNWDGSVLTIDLTSVVDADTGLLRIQLINSDSDLGSSVTIRPLSNELDPAGSEKLFMSLENVTQAAGPTVDLTSLSAAADAKLDVGNIRFDQSTGLYAAELRLHNPGTSLGRNVVVAFPGLPSGVTLRNRSGTTAAGAPYINFAPAISRGGLSKNARSESLLVEFDNPSGVRFTIAPQVLASVNHPPVLAAINPLIATPGQKLVTPLIATDVDGDGVTFALSAPGNSTAVLSLPTGALRNGQLEFTPQLNELGTYTFDVIASDGALQARQTVTLNVVADPITTTRISGVVKNIDNQALAGVPIEIAGFSAITTSSGQFTIALPSMVVPTEAFNIAIPAGDPMLDPFNTGTQAIPLRRARYDVTTGDNVLNPRQHPNLVTSLIDASMVYGSDDARAAALRTFSAGKLKTSSGDLLPFNNAATFPAGTLENDNAGRLDPATLFAAGDVRANENVALLSIQTLLVREHNRLASDIQAANPSFNDEKIYQLARRMVGAMIQHITYSEYLPLMLGSAAIPAYTSYDPNVDPGVSAVFSTAAFRLGHTQLFEEILRLDASGNSLPGGPLPLANAFFTPEPVKADGIEPYLRGLVASVAQDADVHVIDAVRNFLFGPPGSGGMDLAAMNIQRSRDMGLPSYNQGRKDFGLPAATSFSQITSDVAVQVALQAAYGTVDKVDLWIGGIAEDHVAGSMVGPLFRAILVDQFTRTRDGDRLWFENGQFTASELQAIRATSLTALIQRNTNITGLAANAFTKGTPPAGSLPGGSPAGMSASEFRSANGTGNNLTNLLLGSSGTNLVENFTRQYGDGVSTPGGAGLPNPRTISNLVNDQNGDFPNAAGATGFLVYWGQFLDHDLGLTPGGVSDTLKILGNQQANPAPNTAYPFVAERMDLMLDGRPVFPGVNNVIERPIYLPKLDLANAKTIDPNVNTLVTTAAIPGMSVLVQAGTLQNRQGSMFSGQLSITLVPPSLTPAALPPGMNPDLVVTIQPADMVFTTPAPMTFPNTSGFGPGFLMDLWSINPVTGQFDDVGDMQVSADGTLIETISGGIRNSSWHFPIPSPPPHVTPNERTPKQGCPSCEVSGDFNSEVLLHSGVVMETHDLVAYQSQGISRGVQLVYDSLRADPRHIIPISYDNIDVSFYFGIDSRVREALIGAKTNIFNSNFRMEIPGGLALPPPPGGCSSLCIAPPPEYGWNYWSLPKNSGAALAGLQADLSDAPSGIYRYEMGLNLIFDLGALFSGSAATVETDRILNVNSTNSPFGSGWGISGLQVIIADTDGSLMIVDGDGSEWFFEFDVKNHQYINPPGDFSKIEKLANGTYRRTLPDKMSYQFDSAGRLATLSDRNGNVTTYGYDGQGKLMEIIDPVGLKTTFGHTGNLVSSITDPAGRLTRLDYDPAGNLIRVTDPDGSQRNWDYDAKHHMVAEVDQLGRREQSIYGFHGRATGAIRKDGTRITIHAPQTEGIFPPDATTDYRNPPRMPSLGSDAKSGYADANGNVTSTNLDGAGQALSGVDPGGPQATVQRDASNLPVTQTNARGFVVRNTFDERGNLLSSQDSLSFRTGSGPQDGVIGIATGNLEHFGSIVQYTFPAVAGELLMANGLDGFQRSLSISGPGLGENAYLDPFGFQTQGLTIPETGIYSLTIQGYPGTYSFRLLSLGQVPLMILDQPIQKTNSLFLESFVFPFDAVRNQRFVLQDSSSGVPANATANWTVLGPKGSVNLPFGVSTLGNSNIDVLLESPGRYYLILSPYATESDLATLPPISVSIQARLIDPVEVTTLGLNQEYQGKIAVGESVEIPIRASQGDLLRFRFLSIHDGYAITIRLKDMQGNEILPGQGFNFDEILRMPRSETVLLVLQNNGSFNELNYHFRLDELALAETVQVGDIITSFPDEQARLFRFQGQQGQRLYFGTNTVPNTVSIRSEEVDFQKTTTGGYVDLPRDGVYYLNVDVPRYERVVPILDLSRIEATALRLDSEVSARLTESSRSIFYQLPDKDLVFAGAEFGDGYVVHQITEDFDNYLYTRSGVLSSPENGSAHYLLIEANSQVALPFTAHFRTYSPRTSERALTLGQVLTGTIEPNEKELFHFDGVAGQQIFLDNLQVLPDFPHSPFDFQLSVEDSDFPIQYWSADSQTAFELPDSGRYVLQLRHASLTESTLAKSVDYRFRLSDVRSAMLAKVGQTLVGQLNPGTETDLYRLTGSFGQRIRVQRPVGDSTVLEVFSVFSSELLEGDQFEFQLPADGQYTISIHHPNPQSTAAIPYAWQLTAVSDAPVVPEGLNRVVQGSAGEDEIVATFSANLGTGVLLDGRIPRTGFSEIGYLTIEDVDGNILSSLGLSGQTTLVVNRSGQFTVRMKGISGTLTNPEPYELALWNFDTAAPLLPSTDHLISKPTAGTEPVVYLFKLTVRAGEQFVLDATPATESGFDQGYYASTSLTKFRPSLLATPYFAHGVPTRFDQAGDYLVAVEALRDFDFKLRLLPITSIPFVEVGTQLDETLTSKLSPYLRRIHLEQGQQVLFDFRSDAAQWTVYDADATSVAYAQDRSSAIYTVPKSGDYLISRRGNSQLSSSFSYSTNLTSTPVFPLSAGSLSKSVYTYDPMFNQLTSMTDEQGRMMLLDIDPTNGNIRSTTRVVGDVGGNDDLVTRFTYTASGQPSRTTDALGRITQYDYDALGRLVRTTQALGSTVEGVRRFEYDAAGNVVATTDENGHRGQLQYDAKGRVVKTIAPDPDGSGPLAAPTTEFSYDARGNLVQSRDAMGHVTSVVVDAMDRVLERRDAVGNLWRNTYDGNGNLVRTVDPLGKASVMKYDGRDRLVSSTDPVGYTTQFAYDTDNNLTSLRDASGNVTSFAYDARGRKIAETDPLGLFSGMVYNGANDVVRTIDRLGRQTQLNYDDIGRLFEELWLNSDGSIAKTIHYSYDAASNLVDVSDDVSNMQYAYDARNRVTEVAASGPNGLPTSVLNYSYDVAGNLLSTVDEINGVPGGTNANLYDALDRITRIVQSGTGIAPKRVDLQYNELSLFTSLARFSDVAAAAAVAATSYSYDTLNRVSSITHRNATNTTLNSYAFQFDKSSRITRITDIDGATDYSYDTRDQLTGANHSDAANPDETYAYDATGNRTASQRHGTGYKVGDGVANSADNNRLTSDGTYNYEYDVEGNLIRRVEIATGNMREFTWDHRNRLIEVVDRALLGGNPTQVVQYSYDTMNRRIAKHVDATPADAVDGAMTYFIYDGDDVLVEYSDPDGSGPSPAVESMRYLHGPAVDQVLAQEDAAGTVLWHLADHLGTVRDLVSNTGTVVNHLKYDSYGNVIAQSNPSEATRYQFTGREFDEETQLMYYRARYYDAAIGRFISEDPIGFDSGDLSLYRYVENLPTLMRDPRGEYGQVLAAAGGAGVGYVTGFWANVAGQMYYEGLSFDQVDFSQAYISGGVGAASGALATNKALSAAALAGMSGVANLAQYALTTKRCQQNRWDAIFSLGTGILGAGIGGLFRPLALPVKSRVGALINNATGSKVPVHFDSLSQLRANQQANLHSEINANHLSSWVGSGFGAIQNPASPNKDNPNNCGCQ